MIQIYGPENTDYTNNGDITLLPTSCELACEINGAWELTMNHPLDAEERWKTHCGGGGDRLPNVPG